MEGPDATGTVVKMRSVVEYKDDARVMTGYASGPGGQEVQVMRITYRKKQ
jgi:hypothetical protein